MKGVVFNLLEKVVTKTYGEDVWDDLLDASGLDGVYTSLGSYSDEEMGRIVCAASEKLQLPRGTVIRWFGREALPFMAEAYPHFFTGHQTARTFILSLNDIIHPEVRKLYPGADVPVFDFETREDGDLIMGYKSARKLCFFAHGLMEGAAAFYNERLVVEEPTCMHRGDDKCVFHIRLESQGA